MTPVIAVALILIGVATILGVVRLLAGPTSFDRLLASDMLVVIATAFLAVFSVISGGTTLYLDVAIVYAVIGFIGVVTIARFLRGKK
jgi:multicomponent Na+:H+ antiporter subunit F